MSEPYKLEWKGTIRSIQPRTRVWRYLTDNRTHYHIGYNIFLEGECEEGLNAFSVAISARQQQKGMFRIGDIVQGTAWTKKYPQREFADYYKAGEIRVIERNIQAMDSICPWTGCIPSMEVYEERGARMLSMSLWKGKCFKCYYAEMANVEIQ